MTTSALKKYRIERADVVIGPYEGNDRNSALNRNLRGERGAGRLQNKDIHSTEFPLT